MKVGDIDIQHRLGMHEDRNREFTEIKFSGDEPKEPKRDELADEIAAFANASGGVLLCSVTDSGEVMRMTRGQMERLEKMIGEISTDAVKPPLRPEIGWEKADSGDLVLVVDIPRGEVLHRSPGGCFRRIGSSKRRMSADEELRLSQRRAQSRCLWFDKQPVPDTGLNILDEKLWMPLIRIEDETDVRDALTQAKLLARDHEGSVRATVAGVLLGSKEPHKWLHQANISATLYSGPDRASPQLDSQEIVGPLHHQIKDALLFVRRRMTVAARKEPWRIDMPQYSMRAVFEAVVNAVAHRDYSITGRRIRLAMFDDRLEISSPGELPSDMTVCGMTQSQSTRNEALAAILGRVRTDGFPGSEGRQFLMERRGDGVRIILRETRELCGKDPEYEMVDGKELHLRIPAATHRHDPCTATIRVRSGSQPLPGVELLVLYPDNTRLKATTDDAGEARVDLYTPELPMRVFAAAPGKAAHCVKRWMPASGSLEIGLDPLPRGGSAIFPDGEGGVPGLSGLIRPKRDRTGRNDLYADGIGIDEYEEQPVAFLLGTELRLTDTHGRDAWVRVIDIAGESSLVEYRSAPMA